MTKQPDVHNHLSMEERIKIVEDIRIMHPNFTKAYRLIEDCHKFSKLSADPQCMLIVGPSGSGKSTVFQSYVTLNDKIVYEETQTKKVILSAEIPSPTTIATVVEALLAKLGDPFPTRGTIGNKNHRLMKFIKDCGVELIMLDEFQNFVDPDKQRVLYQVSEWFKTLVNTTQVPVVLFGLEGSLEVLKCNEQLSRRFPTRYHLQPFSFKEGEEQDKFRRFLAEVDKRLPFTEFSGLSDMDMSEAIFIASNGLIDSVMKLIRLASRLAIEGEQTKVTKTNFADAFKHFTYLNKGDNSNPFVFE